MSFDDSDTDPRRWTSPQNNKRITGVLPPIDNSWESAANYPPSPYPTNQWESAANYPPPSYPTNQWESGINYSYQSSKHTQTDALIQEAINADPSNPRQVGITQLQLISKYHNNVLQQAEQSFRWALIAAGIGLVFFLASISFLLLKQPTNISYASLISGALVELISAINFLLYGKASTQLASFHLFLDRTHRFLLADSVCENLKDNKIKDDTRAELIRKIMEAKSSTGLLVNLHSKSNPLNEK